MTIQAEVPTKGDSGIVPKTTENNGSLGELSTESYYIDPVKERKMMRKFDVSQSRRDITNRGSQDLDSIASG